ncbi:MAG: hypothetical protein RAP03_16120, partial [Candidatus Electryonea clarkiae]|nr:hypothetical protein [Candidatus Electryonea clarkiae]
YSTPKVIIGAIAAGMQIVQKIWTIRIEKLDEKGTREISGLKSTSRILPILTMALLVIFSSGISGVLAGVNYADSGNAIEKNNGCGKDCPGKCCAGKTAGIKGADTGMKMKGTMHEVYSSDDLYTCLGHSSFVSSDADLNCPVCKTGLTKMSDKQVAGLRASHPKGCTMCPVVEKGDSNIDKCLGCKMELKNIENPEDVKTTKASKQSS